MTETQVHIINILKIVLKYLDENNLRYYMQGGTMLGAIRHKGFIPWDDDVDIGMMRKDYEYLLNNISDFLPENLELNTYYDNSKHHYYFSRIIDKRHLIKRSGSAKVRYEYLWVDIFPLDGMPNNYIILQIHKFQLSFYRFLYHLSCIEKVNINRPGRPFIEKIVINLALIFRKFIKIDTLAVLNKLDKILKKYPESNSKYIINFMGQTTFAFNEMFDRSIYDNISKYNFEDIELFGPKDYDLYLKTLYGNYMTPPKNNEKNAHFAELLK